MPGFPGAFARKLYTGNEARNVPGGNANHEQKHKSEVCGTLFTVVGLFVCVFYTCRRQPKVRFSSATCVNISVWSRSTTSLCRSTTQRTESRSVVRFVVRVLSQRVVYCWLHMPTLSFNLYDAIDTANDASTCSPTELKMCFSQFVVFPHRQWNFFLLGCSLLDLSNGWNKTWCRAA